MTATIPIGLKRPRASADWLLRDLRRFLGVVGFLWASVASGLEPSAERVDDETLKGTARAAAGARLQAEEGNSDERAAALLEEARRWIEAGRLEDAETALNRVLALDPDDGATRALLGHLLLLRKRDHGAALVHLERAAELGIEDPRFLFDLGSARWETGDAEGAARALQGAVEGSGRSPLTVHQLGRFELWRGRYQAAVDLLQEAAIAMPGAVDVRYDLALALDRSERTEEAAEIYSEVVRRAPDHIQARYGLARALQRLGRHAPAAEEMAVYDRLYRQDQEHIREQGRQEANLDRARLLLRHGESEEALRRLDELPETADVMLVRALALRAAGRPESAVEVLERAVGMEPRRTDLRALLAELRGEGGPR